MSKMQEILEKYGRSEEKLIQILLELQESSEDNCLKEEVVKEAARELKVPYSKAFEVASFYSVFSTVHGRGKNIIEVCVSAPCHVNGAKPLLKMIEKELGIKVGETTEDKKFTLEAASCFGACDIAPAIKIGEKVYGNLDELKLKEVLNSYREVR